MEGGISCCILIVTGCIELALACLLMAERRMAGVVS